MIQNILLLDTETDGIDDSARCIEVACVLYSVTHAAPIRSYASLMYASRNAAERVNHIPSQLLASAPDPDDVWGEVWAMRKAAGAVVAHNADFDYRFVPTEVTEGVPWICSMSDLAWPNADPGSSLINMALAHGLGVATAHRALADCDLLARLLTRVHDMGVDLQAMLARGLRPKATYQALVPYEQNHVAKVAGFKWDGDRKMWKRKMAIDDVGTLTFKVREVAA